MTRLNGNSVTILDNLDGSKKPDLPGVKFIKQTIRNTRALEPIVKNSGFDRVDHLAADPRVKAEKVTFAACLSPITEAA